MSTWNPKANEIFLHALERSSSAERREYIDVACAGDESLRADVEALLAAGEEAGSFLQSNAAVRDLAATLERPEVERLGTLIGRYKLLEQIGEGGFGIVFMAEQQEPVRRKVALKVLKPGMDTRQVVARFEAERQALALMDHPNIAHVFDGGTTAAGRPYFVMDLVKGVPITEYCDQNQIAPRERLELFVQVCEAVQHAHQKGIIHRDIKPSNVLISRHDGTPVVKVIDFGIAKAQGQQLTEKTLFTNFAQLIGTPLYMSPEQAGMSDLDVDTRSDIYSLGVLLYELLTGTTPFDAQRFKEAGFDEMRRIIREEEPPKPSTRVSTVGQAIETVSANRKSDPKQLSRLFRGELDWIVMKALEKDRDRRYETANALAMDVKRYLLDEPVLACPPSAAYRFWKFARRNMHVLAAATLLTTTLVLGAGVSTWQAIRARQATTVSRTKEAEAVAQATKANVVAELLQEMLQSANPDSARGAEYSVRQLLDEFSAKLGDQLKDQPEAEASIRRTIGNAYRRLGEPKKAAPHLRAALALRRQLFGPVDVSVAESLGDLARNLNEEGTRVEAERLARRALAIRQELNIDDSTTIAAFFTLQTILLQQERAADSEAVGKQALELARRLHGECPDAANIMHGLACAARLRGQLVNAEKLARESIGLHRRLHGGDHPETAWGLYELGLTLLAEERFDEAEACLRETIAIFQRHYDRDHRWLRTSYFRLKQALTAQGRPPEMVARELAALSIQSVQGAAGDPGVWLQRAIDNANLGNWELADACFAQLAFHRRDSLGEAKYTLADKCSELGRLFRESERTGEAEKAFRCAVSLRGPLDIAESQAGLAQYRDYVELCRLLAAASRAEEAETALQEILNLTAKLAPELTAAKDRAQLGNGTWLLTVSLSSQGHRELAETAMRKAMELFKTLASEHPEDQYYRQWTAFNMCRLAELLRARGRSAEALEALRQAIDIYDALVLASSQPSHFQGELAFANVTLALSFRDSQRFGDAEKHLRMALEIYSKLIGESPCAASTPGRMISACADLVEVLQVAGRLREAADLSRQVMLECSSALAREKEMFNDRNLTWDRRHLGIAIETLAKSLNGLDETEEAEACLRDANRIWQQLTADSGSEDNRFHLAVNDDALGDFLKRHGRAKEAVESYRAARSIWEELVAEVNREDHRKRLARTNRVIGELTEAAGQLGDAAGAYRQAAEVWDRLGADFPANSEYGELCNHCLAALAKLFAKQGKVEEAEQIVTKGVGPPRPDDLNWLLRRGELLDVLGRSEEARAVFHRAVELAPDDLMIRMKALPDVSRDDAYVQGLAAVYACLKEHPRQSPAAQLALASRLLPWGERQAKAGHIQLAAEAFANAAIGYENLLSEIAAHPDSASSLDVPATAGNIAWYRHELGYVLVWHGDLLAQLGQSPEAEAALKRGLEIHKSLMDDPEAPADAKWRLDWNEVTLAKLYRDRATNLAREAATEQSRGNFRAAIAAYSAAIELVPDNALTHNNLAWLCATCQDLDLRDPPRAVALSQKAVELRPDEGAGWNTLGAAQYRAGDWQAAIHALNKSMELREGGDAFDWFFLAMAYWRQGDKDEALKLHAQAIEWTAKNQPNDEELNRFRAEAAELIGKKEP